MPAIREGGGSLCLARRCQATGVAALPRINDLMVCTPYIKQLLVFHPSSYDPSKKFSVTPLREE